MENPNAGTQPGQLVNTPPVQNPARGDYLNATAGQQAGQVNTQGSTATLDDILAAVRGQGGPASQQQQAQQPVPPVQPVQPVQAEPEPTLDVKVDVTNINTGSPALDVAVETFLSTTGATNADIDRAVSKAIEYGDPGLIDEAFIKERFGDKAANALKLAKAVVQQTSDQANTIISSVYEVAGSKEQWDSAIDVFKRTASPGLVSAAKAMFDSGNAKTTKEAAELVLNFNKTSGVLPVVNPRVQASSSQAASQGLSAAELKAAVHKLNPNSRTYKQDYATLIQMRSLGQSLGK